MSPNGTPSTVYPMAEDANGQLAHVAFVHAGGVDQIFVDAQLVQEVEREGDFGDWDTSGLMLFGLGNEFGMAPRPLEGTLHLAAVYCRALDAAEVLQNYEAGF